MDETDKLQAQQEARAQAPRAMTGTEKARMWAGMNRYLATEAIHAAKAAEEDRPPRPDAGHG